MGVVVSLYQSWLAFTGGEARRSESFGIAVEFNRSLRIMRFVPGKSAGVLIPGLLARHVSTAIHP